MLFANWALAVLSLGVVSGAIVAKDVSIKVVDRDGSMLFDKKLSYPKTFSQTPKVKSSTPLSISFKAETAGSQEQLKQLDQALVSFQHTTTGHEVGLAAKASKSGEFKMEMTRAQFRKHFDLAPGTYNVALVLGSHSDEDGGVLYKLGNVHMEGSSKNGGKAAKSVVYGAREEIQHQFGSPQRMPNAAVSLAFSGVVVAPLVLLLVVWARLGVNVAGVQWEGVVFLGAVAAYVGLAVSYWVGVKLFPTLAYALALALPTFVSGRYALSHNRKRRT
ncbi:proteasome regulatory particle base subunit [Coemansia aciculifera]|uniref:Proteasome regulatory particle base subunit n=1 Tax=Coemansia aciculifera TaxID=417176 RepID=A0ACC1LUT4_9FUNG|nr:proteasome regulatory particle base subunit [Coemansia aciculifera]